MALIEWNEFLSYDSDKIKKMSLSLQIHPLAVENCIHQNQRPKLDDYENHQLLVWYMLYEGRIFELQFLIFQSHLILVTHHLPPEGGNWFEYLRLTHSHRDVWHLLYQALDRATDITWQDLRRLMSTVDNMEQGLFKSDFNPQKLLQVKTQLNHIDFSIGHLASVAQQLQNLCQPKDDLNWKLRDLFDHCERIYRSIALYRNQISSTIDMYWGLGCPLGHAAVSWRNRLPSDPQRVLGLVFNKQFFT